METGKYLEMVFPSMGIRFIAINDDVDSGNAKSGDDILVPVKNIMNETYCRELLRSSDDNLGFRDPKESIWGHLPVMDIERSGG